MATLEEQVQDWTQTVGEPHFATSTVATLEEQVQYWTQTVGEPHSHWIGDTWIPAQGSRVYSPSEIGTLFSRKCTLFVGDSLQRRAADTLHLLLKDAMQNDHAHDVREAVFTDEYFNSKKHDRGYKERFIDPTNSTHGCLSTDWRPALEDVNAFAASFTNSTTLSKHNVVVVGSTVWEVEGSSRIQRNAIQVRQHINETIHLLHENIPDTVLIVWRSSGWCANCGWAGDETVRGRGDNYRIYAANDEAHKVIEQLGAPNLVYLDWGREILPRSIGNLRLASGDGNKYHYGLQARLQFLQMLSELYDRQDPTVLSPPLRLPVTEQQVEPEAAFNSVLWLGVNPFVLLAIVSHFLILLLTKLRK